MKNSFLMLTLAALLNFSCSKKEDSPTPTNPPVSVSGIWAVSHDVTVSGSVQKIPLRFDVRTDGKIYVTYTQNSTAQEASGSWTFSNNLFKTTYTYSSTAPSVVASKQFSFSGTLKSSTRVEGTWGNGTNESNGGAFFMDKQ